MTLVVHKKQAILANFLLIHLILLSIKLFLPYIFLRIQTFFEYKQNTPVYCRSTGSKEMAMQDSWCGILTLTTSVDNSVGGQNIP